MQTVAVVLIFFHYCLQHAVFKAQSHDTELIMILKPGYSKRSINPTSVLMIQMSLCYGQFTLSQRHQCSYKLYLCNKDTLLIQTLCSVPLVSVLKRFHCKLYMYLNFIICIKGAFIQCIHNLRGERKKALSDILFTTRFSFQIILCLLVKQKENLALHQVSLRVLFQCNIQSPYRPFPGVIIVKLIIKKFL